MKLEHTFYIRRYWFSNDTPEDIMNTLNWRRGWEVSGKYRGQYVDVHYIGEADKSITMMELRYAEWIVDRESISYTVEGDDGLET